MFRYHIKGELKGKSEVFIQNLPGFPDHIRLSSKGGYWLGIATMRTDFFDLMQQYPRAKNFIAKVSDRVVGNSGNEVNFVNMEAKPSSQ